MHYCAYTVDIAEKQTGLSKRTQTHSGEVGGREPKINRWEKGTEDGDDVRSGKWRKEKKKDQSTRTNIGMQREKIINVSLKTET